MKSNPLFHDSTVSQGSNVQTKFELIGYQPVAGDRVYLRLSLEQEPVKNIEMLSSDSVFSTSVWLEHRKEVLYQFYVKRGDVVVSASKKGQALALHTVVDVWEEEAEEVWRQDFEKSQEESKEEVVIEPKLETQDEVIDNLIEKWDL